MMESPEVANEMAWPMVLQAVFADVQSLTSLPLTPSTYHVVLARAVEVRAKYKATSRLRWIGLIATPPHRKVPTRAQTTDAEKKKPRFYERPG